MKPREVIEHPIYEYVFTPDVASDIIGHTMESDYNFRKPGRNVVTRYAAALKSDTWQWYEAAPIRLSHDWQFCSDGLHRLAAVVASGVPMRALVLAGNEYRADLNTDRGAARTLAQYLAHDGQTNAPQKAAIVRRFAARIYASVLQDLSESWLYKLIPEVWLIEYLQKYQREIDDIIDGLHFTRGTPLNATGYSVALLESRLTDEEYANELHAMMTAPLETVPEEHPAAVFRKSAINRFNITGQRLTARYTADSIVRLFDLIVEGETVKRWSLQTSWRIRQPTGFPIMDHVLHDPNALVPDDS